MGYVISIANQKGGVGKTTTVINLSAALAKLDKKVLIIDLDEQTNASLGLGLNRELINNTSYDLLKSNCDAKECTYLTNNDNINIIPSSFDMTSIEIDLSTKEFKEKTLYNKINEFKNNYDYVIIDCPPSLGVIVNNALYASDSVIIPVECDYYSYDSLTQMINKINQVQKIKNNESLNLIIEGILFTKLDKRNNFGETIINKVKELFPFRVFDTIINRSVDFQEAPMYGQSVIEYDEKSRGSKEYLSLAKEILKRVE